MARVFLSMAMVVVVMTWSLPSPSRRSGFVKEPKNLRQRGGEQRYVEKAGQEQQKEEPKAQQQEGSSATAVLEAAAGAGGRKKQKPAGAGGRASEKQTDAQTSRPKREEGREAQRTQRRGAEVTGKQEEPKVQQQAGSSSATAGLEVAAGAVGRRRQHTRVCREVATQRVRATGGDSKGARFSASRTVVSSNDAMARRIWRGMAAAGLEVLVSSGARDLGIDNAVGDRRQTVIQAGRRSKGAGRKTERGAEARVAQGNHRRAAEVTVVQTSGPERKDKIGRAHV